MDEGRELVSAARNSIELFLRNPHFTKSLVKKSMSPFRKRNGVFVTLRHYPTKELRGMSGFIEPMQDVGELVVDAAISAAFEDRRFIPISINELQHLIIEVSIISNPQQLTGSKLARSKAIELGRHGLILEYGTRKGIVLPRSYAKFHESKKHMLEEACKSAGIGTNLWAQPMIKLYKFESTIFAEETPEGNVVEVRHPSA